ncbi:beta-glucosidase [Ideonella sp. 4Y11]|uniref:Beta-glucosidase n=1 Tax=Ideonella aquatica TaxID=2824119 RepID=A0A941BS49_9BURK|nr:GH1 family beta-glucosidase [Ideonella aquatica]MBQ0961215.1 beta-glucosidase [Ideonella aquatica]
MTRTPAHDPFFPPEFVWGVATSAFQIEGAAREAGKGESIWDRFCRQPGAIADGSNGDVACDHFHRLDQDLDLIARLGVDAYRFSISWPRVQPDGRGAFNEAGLAFYDRLVDGLLSRGLRPYLTLNHWDLPQTLQDGGGWAVRDTVHRFVDYARAINARLGDRLSAITTHNEPWVMAVLGHESGIFAPGVRHRGIAMQVAHHLLLSHGLALQALRADGCPSRLGIVLNLSPIGPATDSPEDRAAAWLEDGRLVRWYLDPLLRGRYPDDVWQHLGADAPRIEPGDLAAIATPMDYLGINYYTRGVVSASGAWSVQASGLPLTDMGWEVVPEGLTELLLRMHRDWTLPPIYVMENGAAFIDQVVDGQVMDTARRDYIARHIEATGRALAAGVPMAGYMVWSLMDNFEWASGYAKRFGIVHVDYASLARTPKLSYHWYREFLRAQRAQRPQRHAA